MEKQRTCEERVQENLESTLEDLRVLWAGYMGQDCPECDGDGYTDCPDFAESEEGARDCSQCDKCDGDGFPECETCEGSGTAPEEHPDLGSFWDYGLCFDYVPDGTFSDQDEGYFRYQLSTGGPGDEFRFFVGYDHRPYRVEYWFLDWFDGASRTLYGQDRDLLLDIFATFEEIGSVEKAFEDATD